MRKKIADPDDWLDFQLDIDSLAEWSSEWKLLFNEEKSAILYFFWRNATGLPTMALPFLLLTFIRILESQ